MSQTNSSTTSQDKATVLVEARTPYSFDNVEGWTRAEYTMLHLPTHTTHHRLVYLENAERLPRLLSWWNRQPHWKAVEGHLAEAHPAEVM